MKPCLNTERTWGFWRHQRQPNFLDFVFLQFWGWWLQSVAAVATAVNNKWDWKMPRSLPNKFSRGCPIFAQRWQEMCRTEGRKMAKIKEKLPLSRAVRCNSSLAPLASYLNIFQQIIRGCARQRPQHLHQAKCSITPREQLVYIQPFGPPHRRLPFVFICTGNWFTLIR